jgi:hypothetical protein
VLKTIPEKISLGDLDARLGVVQARK